MGKKTLYIAYGSNLNLEQMAYRCPTAKIMGKTVLEGYKLLFRGSDGGAVATVEKCESNCVPVLIWELEPSDELALDIYEGYPRFYRKEYINVQLDGKWIDVMIYVMNEGRKLGLPSNHYYDVILKGYKSAGFDISILKQALKVQ